MKKQQKILKTSSNKPPNNLYEKCRDKFGVDWDAGVIFTYGDTVYCKYPLSEDIQIHEQTHVEQQTIYGKDAWWDRYLIDSVFRSQQEEEAYINQWNWIKENCNRDYRRAMKSHIRNSMVKYYGDSFTREYVEKLIN